MNSARNIAAEYAASKSPAQYAIAIEEAATATVTAIARTGSEGALSELLERLDSADDREAMLLEILKAASKK